MTYPNLHLLLRAANRRVLLVGLCQAVLIAISLFLFGLLVALTVDAVFALPSWGLLVLDVALLFICLWMLARMIKMTRRNRFDSRRVARMLEHRLGITDSSLINSIELREGQRAGVSQQLMQESIAKGEQQARRVSIEEAVQMRPARRAGLWAAGICSLMLLAYLCAPSVFGRGITRLIDPTGDHPPFTLVEFTVQVAPEPVYHGDPATIQVNLAGPDLPDRADLVFADQQQNQRIPMYSTGPNEYLLTLDRVEDSRDFFIDTPKGRSERYRLTVTMVPLLESAKVTYRYPGYTDWPQDGHDIMRRDIRAIAATDVEIEVSSNLPLSRATLRLFDDQRDTAAATEFDSVTLEPDEGDPTIARGRMTLTRSARGHLQLVGTNEAVSPDPLQTRVVVYTDRQPRVEITQPEPVVVAVEDWQIPVTVQAIDDVQISSLQLSMAINGFSAPALSLPDDVADPRQAVGQHLFDLAELGARPGDLITYYATAFDNHPSGGQFVDSQTHVIQVISTEEYTEYMRRSYRMEELQAELSELSQQLDKLKQQREELLEELQELQEQMQQSDPLSPEDQQRMQQLKQQLEQYAEQLQTLADQLKDRLDQPQLYDMEQSYREMLEKMSQQLSQQAQTADQLQQTMPSASTSTPNSEDQQAMDDAAEQFRQQNAPFDQPSSEQMQQNQDLSDAFQKADEMVAQAERISNVIQQQRDLADRMQQFQNSPQLSPEQQQRASRLAREQEMLRQELAEAVSSLEEAARHATDQLPKTSADATKMCQGIRQSGAMGDQDSAAQSAREGTGDQAHQSAEQAANKLESLLSQCDGTGESAAGELDAGLSLSRSSIRQSLQQLSQGRSMPGMKQGQGQQGRGMGGSMSRYSLHGPNAPMTGKSDARTGRMTAEQANGNGRFDSSTDGARAAESMNVESRIDSSNGAGNLNGVPVGYRDQAEAYFRRLAEESE